MTTRHDITIVSADNPVRGWYFTPATPGPWPGIVMAHGFSAVKEMGLEPYARCFADAGFAVVVFDHPNFGESGGTPRQEVDPDRQLRAYRDAVAHLGHLDDVDADRIGVWGTSFSGGHAFTLAATEPRVKAAVAQTPYLGGPAAEVPAELDEVLVVDEAQRVTGADPIMLPVVTDDPAGGGALSPDPAAAGWFARMAEAAPTWRNEVTLRSIVRLLAYRPIERAAQVVAPILLLAEVDDVLAPAAMVTEAAALVEAPHELVRLEGSHFDIYERHFPESSAAALDWFRRWL